MRIKEFAEKYGVSKREVDYWTLLGFIRCTVDKTNSYRDYAEKAEEDIKRLIIIKAMGMPLSRDNMRKLDAVDSKDFWYESIVSQIEDERNRALHVYESAIRFLNEMTKEA